MNTEASRSLLSLARSSSAIMIAFRYVTHITRTHSIQCKKQISHYIQSVKNSEAVIIGQTRVKSEFVAQ